MWIFVYNCVVYAYKSTCTCMYCMSGTYEHFSTTYCAENITWTENNSAHVSYSFTLVYILKEHDRFTLSNQNFSKSLTTPRNTICKLSAATPFTTSKGECRRKIDVPLIPLTYTSSK